MPATLSQIQAWSTEHLVDAAAYWTQTADRWEDAFLTMRNQAQSITWHGAGGDALRQRTGADLSVVTSKADLLRQAAGIARNGASDISAAQRRVLYGVEDAQNAGFTVGQDLSVTDTRSTSPAERATRQAQAEAFAADLRLRAEQLEGADTKVSGQLTAATAGLTGGGFAAGPGSSHSTAADNRTTPGSNRNNGAKLVDYFKQDGGPQPQPQPAGPQPAQQPSFLDQYQQQLTSPGQPPQPPITPMPSFGPRPDPGPQPKPGPMPPAVPEPSFGQCVGAQVKANVGQDMIKDGFKGAVTKAGIGAVFGAGLTPELGGAGAIPGAVLGFVGGFAQGLIEAPAEAAAKGAWECIEQPIPGLPKP